MFESFLLAAEASGFGLNAKTFALAGSALTSYFANQTAQYGTNLDKHQLDLRMQEEQLATTEQALQKTQDLRYALSSQNVLAAAKGQRAGQGTPLALANKSQRNYQEDINNLNLNARSKENQLKLQKAGLDVKQKAYKGQLQTKFLGNLFNSIDLNAFDDAFSPKSKGLNP